MQKARILVSVIVPLYNKENYFERCFNSIARQTYGDIECVIVEDCSTDKSLELAESLIASYNGSIDFVLIKHEINAGVSSARNTGINNASGQYAYFLDADDEITDNCISSLISLVLEYPGVDMVQGNHLQINMKGEKYFFTEFNKLPRFYSGNYEIKKKYFSIFPRVPWNKLINMKFLTNNNLFFKNGIIHEDVLWAFFLLKNIGSFAYSSESLYTRYLVPDSIMRQTDLTTSISSILTLCEDMLSNLDVDLLDYQLFDIRKRLYRQKKRILSDEKYFFLLARHRAVSARVPSGTALFFLAVRYAVKKAFYNVKMLLKI